MISPNIFEKTTEVLNTANSENLEIRYKSQNALYVIIIYASCRVQ